MYDCESKKLFYTSRLQQFFTNIELWKFLPFVKK